jgi:hypothetical protein
MPSCAPTPPTTPSGTGCSCSGALPTITTHDTHDTADTHDTEPVTGPLPAPAESVRRLCVFDLDLTCGHRVTISCEGWYPVSVSCCDRLGGSWSRGTYVPFASSVEYVTCRSERYEQRPPGTPREPTVLLHRLGRTDDPGPPRNPSDAASSGRFPERVGAPAHSPDQRPGADQLWPCQNSFDHP